MEAREYSKPPPFAIPLQLIITGIKTTGRYLSLLILAVVSNDYAWKPTKQDFDFDIFSRIPLGGPRADLFVNVLLHELYPTKHASTAVPVDRDEQLSTRDFIQALQKIYLEGGTPNNVDENSFVYRPASSTPPCSTSWTPNLPSKPSPSQDEIVELLPISRSTPSPVPGDSVWSGVVKVEAGNSDTAAPIEISELSELIDPRSALASAVEIEEPCSSLRVTPDLPALEAPLQSENPRNAAEDEGLDVKRPLQASAFSLTFSATQPVRTSEGCSTYEKDTLYTESNTLHVRPFSQVLCLHSDGLLGITSPNETTVKVEDSTNQSVQPTDDPVFSLSTTPSTLVENSSRTSRRKSVLKPLQFGQRRSRSTSFSSISDLEPPIGPNQDSELDYHPFVLKQYPSLLNSSHSAFNRGSLCATSSKSCGSLSTIGSLVTSTGDISVFDHEEFSNRPPHQLDGSISSDILASHRSFGRRWYYVQRDITALEYAKVPFSYEEIVNASSEKFKEMKSVPHLTQRQLDVMLDARRRATNRQAAERCRRSKLATRDDLSEQLAALRTERQLLVRQIAQARQRKQRASDALLAEQKRVLSLLCGPEGDELKYSDWRVRLTHDGEVVVVAVGQ